jgi:hypothetical protein
MKAIFTAVACTVLLVVSASIAVPAEPTVIGTRNGWTISLLEPAEPHGGQVLQLSSPDGASYQCRLTAEFLRSQKTTPVYFPFVSARFDGDWNGDGKPEVLVRVKTTPAVRLSTGEQLPTDAIGQSEFLLSVMNGAFSPLCEIAYQGTVSGYPLIQTFTVLPRSSGWPTVVLWEMSTESVGTIWKAVSLRFSGARYEVEKTWTSHKAAAFVKCVDRVNLHEAADMLSKSVGAMQKGTSLTPVDISPVVVEIEGYRASWMQVRVEEGGPLKGKTGWVFAAYVSPW